MEISDRIESRKTIRRECYSSGDVTVDTTTTILAGRYCLIPVDLYTQESLVANRMATLHVCSKECGDVLVSYVLEPILGEGFACRMDPYFEQIIQHLSA